MELWYTMRYIFANNTLDAINNVSRQGCFVSNPRDKQVRLLKLVKNLNTLYVNDTPVSRKSWSIYSTGMCQPEITALYQQPALFRIVPPMSVSLASAQALYRATRRRPLR